MAPKSELHKRMAAMLFEAEESGTPLDPAALASEDVTFDDAYAIQAEIASLKMAAGRMHIGWKTMGTNPALLAARGAGMTEPGRGYLFKSALAETTVALPEGRGVFAEPEVSFLLQRDVVGRGATAEEVLAATREVFASIEVAWSRFEGRPTPAALIADNAGAARLVRSPRGFPVSEVDDLSRISVEFFKNGESVGSGTGANVLGHPANAVAWLANQLARSGLGLKAGQIILAGSLTLPVEVRGGDAVLARFDKLGDVEVRFI
jgi:2-keto-4-pentenoate hydratase